jgi:serine/threonine protein kinase
MTPLVHYRQSFFDLRPKDKVIITGIPYFVENAMHGGMGCVLLLCQDPNYTPSRLSNLGFKIALKAVLPESADADGIALFKRELTVWTAFQHPNIVRLLDIVDGGDAGWIAVMDWCYGSLRDILNENRTLTTRDATYIIINLISGLSCAYSQDQVLHLDLKPENTLYHFNLTPTNTAENSIFHYRFMVSDWGLSSIKQSQLNAIAGLPPTLAAAQHTFNNMGTISYMAPERFKIRFTSSISSDMFSLGLIYLEMLVGRLPLQQEIHPAETIQSGQYLAIAKDLLRSKQISKSISDIILSMISFSPMDRPSSYDNLTKAILRAWRSGK